MPNKISKRAEDYLEAIHGLIQRKGYARTRDIARDLGVSPPTVTEMLGKLDSSALIIYEKYSGIRLTDEGARIARIVKKRHDTIKSFLETILIQQETADRDACRLEHELSPESIEQLSCFMEFLGKESGMRERFRKFCSK